MASTLPNRSTHDRLACNKPYSTVTFDFDDQDWDSAYPTPREPRNDSAAWKVAAGVVIGAVLGGAAVYAVDRYLPQMALTEAAQVFGAAMRDRRERGAPEPAPPVRDSVAPEPAATAPETPLLQAEAAPPGAGVTEPAPPPAVSQRKPEPSPQARAELDRKVRAWKEYYQRPRHCVENPVADTLVDCANHYIRARREFEAAYRAGSN